jgi:sulfoxide reductase heme-binding subunit YedZ
MTDSNAVWYLMRGSGVTALLLLTGVVALGVMTSRKTSLPTLPRFATLTLHRSISLLAVVFLALHVVTAALDPYAQVRVVDTLLPFLGTWQAFWLGLGTLSLDLFVAVIVSSLLMKQIGRRAWRAIHWLGYATWPVAFLHSLGMGSDTGTPWLRALCVAMFGAVAAAVLWRVSAAPAPRGNVPPDQAKSGASAAPASSTGSMSWESGMLKRSPSSPASRKV